MDKYDTLFDDTAPDGTIFADKGALDPLAEPDEIVAREDQERELATILNGATEGYLPPTVSIYGPPGAGKTLTTRRVCREFASRHDAVAVEYVNLKECRTLFSAANEILFELTGAKKKAYEGLDGVFEGIWEALEEYPEWTVLLLDEIDQIRHDSNYDPNDFFYRLLRGEGKLKREIQLSAWVISNELLEVDLRLDSRVESVMSDEAVFFPSYGPVEIGKIVIPRVERAFQEGALSGQTFSQGTLTGAKRWGDARKVLTLFRQAGETAAEDDCEAVTIDHIEANIETTEHEETIEKIRSLPPSQFNVLGCVTHTRTREGVYSDVISIKQPVTTKHIREVSVSAGYFDEGLAMRTVRSLVDDLELAGFLDTWVKSRDGPGRVKYVETTFDPEWVRDAFKAGHGWRDRNDDSDETNE